MKKNGPTFETNAIGGAIAEFTGDIQNIVELQVNSWDWWPSLVLLVAGPNHGLRVGVLVDGGFDVVGIIGELPKALKKGLHRYAPCHDRDFPIEWVLRTNGKGLRYELDDLDDYLNRLAERRALMQGGAE